MRRGFIAAVAVQLLACGNSGVFEFVDEDPRPPLSNDPQLHITPSLIDFGRVPSGRDYRTTITLSNVSAVAASVEVRSSASVVACGGSSPTVQFCAAAIGAAPMLIPPSGVAMFDVTYRPRTADQRHAGTLSVRPCPGCQPLEVALTGFATGLALDCAPHSVDFGIVPPGACVDANVECTNKTDVDVQIESTSVTGDPRFDVRAPLSSTTVPPAWTKPITVRFCPIELGDAAGTLFIETDHPFMQHHAATIGLRGRGGGPLIEVITEAVTLGEISRVAPTRTPIVIYNRGSEPLSIQSMESIDEGLTVRPLSRPMTINAGASVVVDLEVTATATGPIRSTLRIATNDRSSPTSFTTFDAVGVDLPDCRFTAAATLDFGTLEIGARNERSFRIHNDGATDCLIRVVRSEGQFSVEPNATRIAGGATIGIPISARITFAGAAWGTLTLAISNADTPLLFVQLSANVLEQLPIFAPRTIDFGNVSSACGPVHRTVRLHNRGTESLSVSYAAAQPSPTWASDRVGNRIIGTTEHVAIDVAFEPSQHGLHLGDLEVSGVTGRDPLALRSELRGRRSEEPNVERFTQNARNKVDVLLLIDGTLQSAGDRMDAARAAEQFLAPATNAAIDYRIGATLAAISGGGIRGHLTPLSGARIVTPTSTPSPAEVLATLITDVVDPAVPHQPLVAMHEALSNPLRLGHNRGFLREDARLAVIVIRDPQTTESRLRDTIFFADFLATLKSKNDAIVFSLGGLATSPSGELARLTGGQHHANDVGAAFVAIADEVFGHVNAFFLEWPAAAETIAVTSFAGPVPVTDWTYDVTRNAVVFRAGATPVIGAEIIVTYQARCP